MVERVSILITNYNYDRFLAEAVESALSQTTPCQVVVVDDGSTDRSDDVLDRLVMQHNHRVTAIKRENGGQAAAMNAGWVEAKAPYVLFLDADDRLHPTAAEEVVAAFEAEPTAAKCQFRLRWIAADGATVSGGFPDPGLPLVTGDLRARMVTNPDDISWQPTTGNAFRASALAEVMPIPEEPYRISADHYLSNLTALTGPVLGIERELGDYRIHGSNADHRSGFDLNRARSILVRTDQTRHRLIEHGTALGLAMPETVDGFLSLTNLGQRLASYRMGPGHPYPDDRVGGLLRKSVRAALARQDISIGRRMLAIGWLTAMAVAPRALVPRVAAMGLTR